MRLRLLEPAPVASHATDGYGGYTGYGGYGAGFGARTTAPTRGAWQAGDTVAVDLERDPDAVRALDFGAVGGGGGDGDGGGGSSSRRVRSETGGGLASFMERELATRLSERGLSVVQMEADGNCLFRAVAHQLYNDASLHAAVRERVCDHLLACRDHFAQFVDGDIETYVAMKRVDGEWGDDLEIEAMCECYDRPIEVFAREIAAQPNFGPLKRGGAEGGEGRDRLAAALKGVEPIRVSYHGASHYNSVVNDARPPPLGPRETHTIRLERERQHTPRSKPTQSPPVSPAPVAGHDEARSSSEHGGASQMHGGAASIVSAEHEAEATSAASVTSNSNVAGVDVRKTAASDDGWL